MTRRRCLDWQDGRNCRYRGSVPVAGSCRLAGAWTVTPSRSRRGCSARLWSRTTLPTAASHLCVSRANTAGTWPRRRTRLRQRGAHSVGPAADPWPNQANCLFHLGAGAILKSIRSQ
jgi:hypothetical protein